MPTISLFAALNNRRVIGKNNELIYLIPEDLKRFKALTMGHPIIMGRKTFESIGRVLPGRKNIVITRQKDFSFPGAVIVDSLEEALKEAKKEENLEEIFVIGGGEIYKQALSSAYRLYLTLVDDNTDGDTFFPDYSEFTKTISEERHVDEKTGLTYSFLTLEK